jgi:hypothetical protein
VRTVVWSTGGVGSIAIDAIRRRPDLELVGVWVHSPDKVGKDAGELAGVEPLGVAATDDADALIALAPDCVVYAVVAGVLNGREAIVIEHVIRMSSMHPPGCSVRWTFRRPCRGTYLTER